MGHATRFAPVLGVEVLDTVDVAAVDALPVMEPRDDITCAGIAER
jgi:hypothetical protein